MPLSAIAVANEILRQAHENGINDITPMKLQKLVYFAHGWYLAATGEPLLNEQVEAWRYGPVIRSLYDVAKQYGNKPISASLFTPFGMPELNAVEQKALEPFLSWIWEQYGIYSGVQLSNMTHQPGTPWKRVIEESDKPLPLNTDIPRSYIESYFANEYERLGYKAANERQA